MLLFWAVQSSDNGSTSYLCRFGIRSSHLDTKYSGEAHSRRVSGSFSGGSSSGLPIFFFTVPKPFVGQVRERQLQALESWLRLRPVKQVILLGDDPSFYEVKDRFAGKVSVEPFIDHNFLGIPQFHSVVARVQAAAAAIANPAIYVLSNADIYTLHDFLPVLQKVSSRFPNWIVTGNRWDVSDFPFSLVDASALKRQHSAAGNAEPLENSEWTTRQWQYTRSGTVVSDQRVREYVLEHGVLHTHGGLDFWAWNGGAGTPRLFETQMPPFAFGRGRYDNWMVHEMLHNGSRTVVDVSTSATAVHVSHSYSHLTDAQNTSSPTFAEARGVKNFWSSNKRTNYEADANIYLSRLSGSFVEQSGMALHVPLKLLPCAESAEGKLCLTHHLKAGSCRCSYSVLAQQTQTEMQIQGREILCGNVPQEIDATLELIPKERGLRTPGFPLLLDDLLPHVGDENETVVLVVASSAQKELVASFACRLRELRANLLIAALDEDMYRHAFTLGLAVYMEPMRKEERYGDSKCEADVFCEPEMLFILPAVLQLLKQGKNVIVSDPGLYWARDPRPYLMSFGSKSLLASLVYEENLPPETARQFNLNFMFGRAEKSTIEALEAVVNFAVAANITEDDSFNAILCGMQAEKWSKTAGCAYDNGLNVMPLGDELFRFQPLSSINQVDEALKKCQDSVCFTLDLGVLALNGTLRQTKIWRQDPVSQTCIHPWSEKM